MNLLIMRTLLSCYLILEAHIVYNCECRILWEETQKQQLLQMSAHLFGMFPSLNSVYSFYLQYFFS